VPGLKCHGGKRHTCSDNEADADAEKSGAEDIPVKLKRKRRKVLRKRKKGKKCVQGMWLCFIVLDTVSARYSMFLHTVFAQFSPDFYQ
jgi:hypothetical protein